MQNAEARLCKEGCLNKLTSAETDPRITENKLTVARRPGVGGWAEWVKGSGGYRLPVMDEQVTGMKGTALGTQAVTL